MKDILFCMLVACLSATTMTKATAQTAATPSPAAQSTALATLNRYLERYCDDTDSRGIGVIASETFDFKLRQRIKASTDTELQRLFVLKNLYQEIESSLAALERGTQQRPGRPRRFDPKDAIAMLKPLVDDVAILDPRDSQHTHQSYHDRIKDMEERLARE